MIRGLTIFFALATILWLSGCGGSSSTNSESDDGKKVFRYNQTGGLTSLDPAFANKRSNIWATTQIYNGLFSFSKNLDVHPELVKEWEISEDGKTYTFTIKEGIRFHDDEAFRGNNGREVLASDFIYSFKRIVDAETGSPGAWIFNDKVLRNAEGEISDTCFAEVPNEPYKFRIYLEKRFPAFLQILAMPYTYVVPKEAIDRYGKDFRSHPVGTGPFKIKNWDEKNSLVLVKNENYWKKDTDGNALPYLDAVQVSFIEDRTKEFLSFKENKLDFLTNIAENSKDEILEKNGQVKEAFASKFTVDKIPYLNTEYVGFYLEAKDGDKNPFVDNANLRKAMSYAVNRRGLVSFLRNGLGTPGDYGFVPAALPSFDSTKVKGYPYNPQKAQELLKEAGFAGGKGLPELTLYTYTSDQKIAQYLQDNWKDIGIKVNIETNQFSTHQEKVDNGGAMMFRGSWLGDYPDAENYLALFSSDNFSPTGPNKTHYKNPAFDNLFTEAHETDNLFARYENYLKMDQLIMEDAPIIVLYYDEIIHVKQKHVTGLEIDPMNNLILETVDIKKEGEGESEKTALK